MKWIGKTILILVGLAVILGVGSIIRNGAPLSAEPGWTARLWVYLTRNVAETKPDHPFPELRPQRFALPADKLINAARQTAVDLGWRVETMEPGQHRLQAVVATPLLRFKDDVTIDVDPQGAHSVMNLRSASRVGRADYGANLGHILVFNKALRQRLGIAPIH